MLLARQWQNWARERAYKVHAKHKHTKKNAIITCMDVEKWLEDSLLTRRTQEIREKQKQLAHDSRGRIRITILYPPGRPLLAEHEALRDGRLSSSGNHLATHAPTLR